MIIEAVDLEEALFRFARILYEHVGGRLQEGRLIRDVFGRMSFVAPAGVSEAQLAAIAAADFSDLAPFIDTECPVLTMQSEISKDLLEERGLAFVNDEPMFEFTLLDRRLAGDDWLQMPKGIETPPPRIAFYGLKGGVGRSTALAIAAADLAGIGKNVLVVDLDLEAPGLGNILLREDSQPEFGVLDWLALAAAGGDPEQLIVDMIGGSPFTTGAGIVDVVPAAGLSTFRRPTGFFSKLSRAYTPGAQAGVMREFTFTQKVERMLVSLSTLRKYDAIFLDVRSGLHETSAASLLGLGAFTLLFGVSSSQTIADYNILLSTVRQSLASWKEAPDIRSSFRMVQGRAGSSPNDLSLYRAACWQLWLDTLYDAVEGEADPEAFSFDVDDVEGPHFPWVIPNSESFLTFDPQVAPGFLTQDLYAPVFGSFLGSIRRMVVGDDKV